MVYKEKGEFVACKNCQRPLYKLNRDIGLGTTITAGPLDPLTGVSQPVNGEPAHCPKCGSHLIPDGMLFLGKKPYKTCHLCLMKGRKRYSLPLDPKFKDNYFAHMENHQERLF